VKESSIQIFAKCLYRDELASSFEVFRNILANQFNLFEEANDLRHELYFAIQDKPDECSKFVSLYQHSRFPQLSKRIFWRLWDIYGLPKKRSSGERTGKIDNNTWTKFTYPIDQSEPDRISAAAAYPHTPGASSQSSWNDIVESLLQETDNKKLIFNKFVLALGKRIVTSEGVPILQNTKPRSFVRRIERTVPEVDTFAPRSGRYKRRELTPESALPLAKAVTKSLTDNGSRLQ